MRRVSAQLPSMGCAQMFLTAVSGCGSSYAAGALTVGRDSGLLLRPARAFALYFVFVCADALEIR